MGDIPEGVLLVKIRSVKCLRTYMDNTNFIAYCGAYSDILPHCVDAILYDRCPLGALSNDMNTLPHFNILHTVKVFRQIGCKLFVFL